MKTSTNTFSLAAVVATLSLTACLDEPANIAPDVAEDAAPGDPAVFAPDGWPLKIGEATTYDQRIRLQNEFLTYNGIVGMHLVGGQVFGAEYSSVNGSRVYLGHFPKKASWEWDVAERERIVPERFRGKIEYGPPAWFVRFDETTGEPYVTPEYIPGRWTLEMVREGMRYHEERMRRGERTRR